MIKKWKPRISSDVRRSGSPTNGDDLPPFRWVEMTRVVIEVLETFEIESGYRSSIFVRILANYS